MIDWSAFLVVAFASALGAGIVVTFYSLGLRLLPEEPSGHWTSKLPAAACFTVCALAVIFGVYLIVPALH